MNPKPNIDQGNLLFQIKKKQKWTPKDTHHNANTFIDYVQNDLSEEKTEKEKKKLSKGEQKAMEDLARRLRKDIII